MTIALIAAFVGGALAAVLCIAGVVTVIDYLLREMTRGWGDG